MKTNPINKLVQWSSLVPLLFATAQLSAGYEDKITESFSTTAAGQLTLRLESSSLDIVTHEGSNVTIEITRTLKSGNKEDFEKELKRLDIGFEQSGNDILCELDYAQTNNG